MDPFVTEDQQVEALKKWWKENGKSVITGLVLGLAIIVGVRTWFDYRAGREQAASLEYQRMESALEKQDTATAQQLAAHLLDLGLLGLGQHRLWLGQDVEKRQLFLYFDCDEVLSSRTPLSTRHRVVGSTYSG